MKQFPKILSIVMLLGLLFLSCNNDKKPIAIEGVLDISNKQINDYKIIDLSGDWEFYWKELLTPQNFREEQNPAPLFVEIPRGWETIVTNDINDDPEGYASYRLTIKTHAEDSIFGIRLKRIDAAYKLWVNGVLVSEIGKVAREKLDYIPKWQIQEKTIRSKSNQIELLLQVCNYDFESGGITRNIQLASNETLKSKAKKESGFDFFLLGVMLIISLYHFVLFLLRKSVKSSLYFSILSIFASALVIVSKDYTLSSIFIPEISWSIQVKLEYIFYFSALAFLVLFISSLFFEDNNKLVIRIILGYSAFMSLFVLFSPVSFFMFIYDVIQFLFVAIALYLAYIVYKAHVNKKDGASQSLIGILLLSTAIIHDVIDNKYALNNPKLLPYGYLGFMLIQAYIISSHFIEAIKHSEQLTEEMDFLNNNLENLVKERTAKVEQQKEELMLQSDSLKVANDEIVKINEILEQQGYEMNKKNKALTDSLNYAKRLQTAVLPDINYIKQVLPEHFIFFRPKDIVSGDFFWYGEVDSSWDFDDASSIQILVAADCTGHGVPGAFMTLLGHNFLNVTVNTQEVTDPEQIIYKIDQQVVETLRQNDPNSIKDGMDISVLSIEQDKNLVSFAGAGNPLYYFRNGEFHEIKGSNFGIGGVLKKEKIFLNHKIEYQSGDVFYIFSDGFADQIGGKDGRKFYKKRFKEFLNEIHTLPMEEQNELIEKQFYEWKGDYKQIDDVLVIGIRMP